MYTMPRPFVVSPSQTLEPQMVRLLKRDEREFPKTTNGCLLDAQTLIMRGNTAQPQMVRKREPKSSDLGLYGFGTLFIVGHKTLHLGLINAFPAIYEQDLMSLAWWSGSKACAP